MNTLIAYGTKHGCTEKCATELSKELDGNVEIINLKNNNKIDLNKYDSVIIGGSVYIGKIQKEVTEFINSNLNELLKKQIGLFICGMQEEGATLDNEITDNFHPDLLASAKSVQYFGGEFIFNKMNFMEKIIIKKIIKITSNKSNIKHDNIKKLAMEMNN